MTKPQSQAEPRAPAVVPLPATTRNQAARKGSKAGESSAVVPSEHGARTVRGAVAKARRSKEAAKAVGAQPTSAPAAPGEAAKGTKATAKRTSPATATKPQSRTSEGKKAAVAAPAAANAVTETRRDSAAQAPRPTRAIASHGTAAANAKATAAVEHDASQPLQLRAQPPQTQATPAVAAPRPATTVAPTSGGDGVVASLLAPRPAQSAQHEGPQKSFRDDPTLDKRIIEGMLDDKDGFLDVMHRQGFGRDAVVRRAAELGLSEALIRQVKGVAADLAGERPGKRPTPSSLGARTCLSCDRIFFSSGPGNRLCTRCRGGDAGLAQL